MSVFLFAFNAVMPIIILILIGFVLKRAGFLTDEFLRVGNKLMFKLCLPALLFSNIYEGVGSFADIKWSTVVFCMPVILLLFFVGVLTAIFLVKDKSRRGVIVQCSFRSNFAIIGTALASGLGGNAAVAVVGILSAFTISFFNVLAVISLTVFNKNKKVSFFGIIKEIITNPLIGGILIGLVFLSLKTVFPVDIRLPFLYDAVVSLGKLATPLALIVLGGEFSFVVPKDMAGDIITGTVLRVIVAPAIALSLAVVLCRAGVVGFGANEFPALIALFASPVAVSSAVMAKEMNADYELASALVVWTSVVSVFTVFCFVVVLRALGML